jgi:6-phosphogluconolactonase (cycloisomerase 2 family)
VDEGMIDGGSPNSGVVDGGALPLDAGLQPVDAGRPVDKRFGIEIITYSVGTNGELQELERTSALPNMGPLIPIDGLNVPGAEVRVSPSGRHLYASIRDYSDESKTMKKRDHNLLVTFDIDQNGRLQKRQHIDSGGSVPEGFIVGNDEKWVAALNGVDRSISLFTIEPTGTLTNINTLANAISDSAVGIVPLTPTATKIPGGDAFLAQSGPYEIGIFQIKNNAITRIGGVPTTVRMSPSYFAMRGNVLYAAGTASDTVSSFVWNQATLAPQSMVRSGRTPEERQADQTVPASDRKNASVAAPVYLDVDPMGQFLVSANYVGGIWLYPLGSDGALKPGKSYWIWWETHAAKFHPNGRWVYAVSKGKRRVFQYEVDRPNAALKLLDMQSVSTGFAQPRHIAFSTDGKYAYVITERSFFEKQPGWAD